MSSLKTRPVGKKNKKSKGKKPSKKPSATDAASQAKNKVRKLKPKKGEQKVRLAQPGSPT